MNNNRAKMKAKQFKIATWFINEDLLHKVDIHYENETKRAYTLLNILASKYFKIDKRKKFNQIEITEEEYKTWYVYFLEYYIDDASIYVGSKEEKEAKRLLKSLIKFFGQSNFDESHRAGGKIKFAISLAKKGVVASQINEGNETKH
jgi:hypothetical protein